MKFATRWNRIRYTAWAAAYDLVVGFSKQRRRAIELLALEPGERVLIVGAGTGSDLPFLRPDVDVLATDLTSAMLKRARPKAGPRVGLRQMDGQELALPDAMFDAVILHLILAVIPDPVACLREAARVVRPGGRISVLDKFVEPGARPGWLRRLANLPLRILATDITRILERILEESGAPLEIEHAEPAGFPFRIALLRKRGGPAASRQQHEEPKTGVSNG